MGHHVRCRPQAAARDSGQGFPETGHHQQSHGATAEALSMRTKWVYAHTLSKLINTARTFQPITGRD
jgi:hypothetical protein